MRRLRFLGFTIVTIGCLVFLLSELNPPNYHKNSLAYEEYPSNFEDYKTHNFNNSIVTIEDVLRQQTISLQQELIDYPFPNNTKFNNYALAKGGTPLRNIIISTWRTGSTFLADVINAVPGNFYHYEPLLDYGIVQIRGPPYADQAVKNLERLLKCDYSELSNYLEYGKDHSYLFTHNTRLWDVCELYPDYCWDSTFLTEFCKIFPFQSMKMVRLRLRLAERLLKNKRLNVKILLLVRDPRGIIQSRKHRDWCPGIPDCDEPSVLCTDMVADYITAIRFKKRYPSRFRVMRYEDLSVEPYMHVEELFKFFDLHFHPQVKMFLDSHTKINAGGVSSTYRNSKRAPFHWRVDLNFSEVKYIEESCDSAMKLWGYVKAFNKSHLHHFYPLTSYTINNIEWFN